MKRFLLLIAGLAACCMAGASSGKSPSLSAFRGVWASDDAEAVVTDSMCIFFYKAGNSMQAVLQIPSAGILWKTIFMEDTVIASAPVEPLAMARRKGVLHIGGRALRKVEEVETVEPYEMTPCSSVQDVGRCLQEWRLGSKYFVGGDAVYCEVNTNRHMFVFSVHSYMVYIRAAATRNNDRGTLFFQNIRMMKNRDTGEYTMSILPDNLRLAGDDLQMDDSQFNPKVCTFVPDGGIYWSLMSHEPDLIKLNGCGGETYEVNRRSLKSGVEWFRYVPYTEAKGKAKKR